ncbi:MAG: complex I subunit 5 family protein [Acidimicrobiales bacterium]
MAGLAELCHHRRGGSLLVLSGIALLYGRSGALNLAQIGVALSHGRRDGLVIVAFALIVSGFFIKAAIVPFHFWLADAYTVAPTPVCILFAGVMSELGLYAIARTYWTVFDGTLSPEHVQLRVILVAAGLVTAVVGAVMCLMQRHLKRLLAFLTISHLGLMLVGIGLLSVDGLSGTAIYVVVDGLVKASLFVCVGILQYRRGHVHELRLRGQGCGLPFTGALFAVGGLAVAAMPPFRTFLGKSLTHQTFQSGYGWVAWVYVAVSVLTGATVLRAAGRVFLGWGSATEPSRIVDRADAERRLPGPGARSRTPASLAASATLLLAGGLFVDVFPRFLDAAQEAAARFEAPGVYARAVLYGRPVGHLPVPSFSPTGGALYGLLASVLGAAARAAGLLFAHRLPFRPPTQFTALATGGTARLRDLHSGLPGDYVAWITLGVAVFGGAFAVVLR